MLDGSFRPIGPGLALILLATLSACGDGGGKPRTLPPVSQSPISSSVTPTGPTAAGAEAFVRRVFANLNHALQTGDTVPYRRDLTTACDCSNLADAIDEAYGSGKYVGAAYVIDHLTVNDVQGNTAAVQIVFHNPPAKRVDRAGRVTATMAPVASRTAVYSVGFAGGGWHVLTVRYLGT